MAVGVVGEAGVGKSRLVRELASCARMGGSAVLVGRCTEASVPFRPLVEVLLAAERVGPDREHPSLRDVRAGLSIVAGWTDRQLANDGPPTSELLVGEAALRCLRLLSPDLVVVIEDLHWADGATLEALSYLIDHIGGERLALRCEHQTDGGFRRDEAKL